MVVSSLVHSLTVCDREVMCSVVSAACGRGVVYISGGVT